MRLIWISLLALAPTSAEAALFQCRADYDGSSHYEVTAETGPQGLKGDVALRYVTDDGVDLHATLSPKSQHFEEGKSFDLEAANDSMGTVLKTEFSNGVYKGTLEVTFGLDHAGPVDLEAICSVR